MTAFLFVVVVLLALLVARNTFRIRRLEQQLKSPRTEPPRPAVEGSTVTSATPPRRRVSFSNFEETFGTNWLNKLGIVILVIGVALFLAYEMRAWGPAGKVAVGYLVSAAMLAAGIVFERREQWRILARAGLAGGWALLYFTTYAMYHVPAARILSSEALDLLLLLCIAAGMVAHTLRYSTQVMSALAFLLAFATINLSHGGAPSLLASAILAIALAFVSVRRCWFELELAGIVAAYVNHYLWLRPVIESMQGRVHIFPRYVASAALLCAYWLIFRASYIVRRVPDRQGEIVSTMAAVLNVALFLAVTSYQSVHPELAFQFFLMLGIVEFVLGQLPVTRRRRAAFIVLSTLGCCLFVAAFPFRYSGETLPATWLALAEALLFSGVFLREIVFRRLGLAVALAASIQMLTHALLNPISKTGGLALLLATAALAFYLDSQWLPRRWPEAVANKLDRSIFEALAYLAGLLAVTAAWIEWPRLWTVVAWAAMILALVFIGRLSSSRIFLLQSSILAALVLFRALFYNLFLGGAVRVEAVGLTIAILVCAFAFLRALRRTDRQALTRYAETSLFFAAFILLTSLLAAELPSGLITLAWGIEALMVFAVAVWLKARSYRLSALALLLLCIVKIVAHDVWGLAPRDRYLTFIVLGAALLAVSYLYTRYREMLRRYL